MLTTYLLCISRQVSVLQGPLHPNGGDNTMEVTFLLGELNGLAHAKDEKEQHLAQEDSSIKGANYFTVGEDLR